MTQLASTSAYAALQGDVLTIQRLLPGPIERIWSYLTDSELRRKWLAAGALEPQAGGAFEFTWRNDELTNPPGQRPPGFGEEHSMQGKVLEISPPRRLLITWGAASDVLFELTPEEDQVLLTVVHRRPPSREVLLNVSAGWHAHLAVLVALLTETQPQPHWDLFSRLRLDYDQRLPA
jgi:uncharacterized protein YndB with AHSA1/START domain